MGPRILYTLGFILLVILAYILSKAVEALLIVPVVKHDDCRNWGHSRHMAG